MRASFLRPGVDEYHVTMRTGERARFCDACNAVIGWFAAYCDECGARVGEARLRGQSPDSSIREVSSIEKDLYQAHIRLVHRHIESADTIKKECDKITRSLKAIEGHPQKIENVKKCLVLTERLIDLEQDWEELQHRYNRHSEGVEEEFLSRIDELEADLELSPGHQEAVEAEVSRFMSTLEEGEESLRETGRFLDIVRARQKSGVLGLWGGSGGIVSAGLLALLLASGGAAYGLVWAQLPVWDLAAALVPAWVGICLLLVQARSQRF